MEDEAEGAEARAIDPDFILSSKSRRCVLELGGIELILKAMRIHGGNASLQHSACVALLRIAGSGVLSAKNDCGTRMASLCCFIRCCRVVSFLYAGAYIEVKLLSYGGYASVFLTLSLVVSPQSFGL